MSHVDISCQEDIKEKPTYSQLALLVDELNERIFLLSTAEQERDIALSEITTLRRERDAARRERDEARTELSRASAYQDEAMKLRKQVASIMAICAIPREELLPQSKLAWITSTEQVPYSAAVHGGNPQEMITSMKRWNMAIGGAETNTNALNDAIKPLEAAGAIKRETVECPDGLRHYSIKVDESMLRFPQQFSKEGEPNKHNGGNKRCPQCGNYCKKRIEITYVCEGCGIDYDSSMQVIEHTAQPAPEPQPEPQPEPTPIRPIQPELKAEPAPLPFLRRPMGCRCGVRHRWIQRHGMTHCTYCEIEYRTAVNE